jgi:hypothetical protein
LATVFALYLCLVLCRAIKPIPTSPVPNNAKVPGSGETTKNVLPFTKEIAPP